MKTKLVPFDIEKAKNGAKVVTRYGLPAKIVDYPIKNEECPILGLVLIEGKEFPLIFTKTGNHYNNSESCYDLFIEEEEQEKTRREYSGTDSIFVPKDDEGIIEELIDAINGLWDNDALPMPLSLKRKDAWIAWLNKQCKKNTADSLEIKPDKWYTCIKEWQSIYMKIGDMFDEGHYYLGSDILKYKGLLEDGEDYRDYFRPWTILDAKPGDILATKNGYNILIFKNIKSRSGSGFSSYYNYNNFSDYSDFKEGSWDRNRFIPATKEQRELLFNKMEEDGYEWDSDKKELHKIGKEVKTRRMTHQELAWWLRDKPEEHREYCNKEGSNVYFNYYYSFIEANKKIEEDTILIRRNGGEWEEPLIEL